MTIGCYPWRKWKYDFIFVETIHIEFFFQIDTKIVWVRNQYLPPQILHNVWEVVFREEIVSNTQL